MKHFYAIISKSTAAAVVTVLQLVSLDICVKDPYLRCNRKKKVIALACDFFYAEICIMNRFKVNTEPEQKS